MAQSIRSKWQDQGFTLSEALKWVKAGIRDPIQARRMANAGEYPGGLEPEGPKPKPVKREKKGPLIPGAFVMIHITEVMDFSPLSGGRTPVAKARNEKIANLAKVFGVDPDAIMFGFGRYLVEVIREKVRWAVQTQTVAGRPMKAIYKPLSERYKNRKVPVNRDKFWVNTDFLISNLRVWRYRGQLYLGYPKHVVHPETKDRKKPVWAALIMMWLEHGAPGANVPARPLFSPIVGQISKNIGQYFDHFYRGVVSRNPVYLKFIRQAYSE